MGEHLANCLTEQAAVSDLYTVILQHVLLDPGKQARIHHFPVIDINDLSGRRFSDPKSAVEQFLGTCSKEEQYWYACVIRRDLGLGITAKGVNKAWPGFIPMQSFQCFKCIKCLPDLARHYLIFCIEFHILLLPVS